MISYYQAHPVRTLLAGFFSSHSLSKSCYIALLGVPAVLGVVVPVVTQSVLDR